MTKFCFQILATTLLSSTNVVNGYAWYNIWNQEFTSTTGDLSPYQYWDGITSELKLSTYYSQFSSCKSNGVDELLDEVVTFYDNYTATAADEWWKWGGQAAWILGNQGANVYYYCTLTAIQVEEYNTEKYEQFQGIEDVYLSFLFNLLEESVEIKTTTEDLATAQDGANWVDFYSECARLVYLITDFESYTAAQNPMTKQEIHKSSLEKLKMNEKVQKAKRFIFGRPTSGDYHRKRLPKMHEAGKKQTANEVLLESGIAIGASLLNQNMMHDREAKLEETRKRLREPEEVGLIGWAFYPWVGLVFGAMNAFPDNNLMSYCTANLELMMEYIEDGIEDYDQDYETDGAEDFYEAAKLIGWTYESCFQGIEENVSADMYADLIYVGMLLNLLFNAGFLVVDVLYFFHLAGLHPSDDEILPYYYFKWIGDFGMRFVYSAKDNDAS